MQLIDAVKNAKVPVKNGEIKVFDKNGNGYANIEVFNVQRESRREGSVACEYKKVISGALFILTMFLLFSPNTSCPSASR